MLSIDDKLPEFKLTAMVDNKLANPFAVINSEDYKGKKWLCLFFWPKDFTFVCPTEIATFGAKEEGRPLTLKPLLEHSTRSSPWRGYPGRGGHADDAATRP